MEVARQHSGKHPRCSLTPRRAKTVPLQTLSSKKYVLAFVVEFKNCLDSGHSPLFPAGEGAVFYKRKDSKLILDSINFHEKQVLAGLVCDVGAKRLPGKHDGSVVNGCARRN